MSEPNELIGPTQKDVAESFWARLKKKIFNPSIPIPWDSPEEEGLTATIDEIVKKVPSLRDDQLKSLVSFQDFALNGSLRREILFRARLTGEALIELKRRLGRHGEWTPYLEKNFASRPQAARKYMSIAKNWEELKREGIIHTGTNLNFQESLTKCVKYLREKNLTARMKKVRADELNEDQTPYEPPRNKVAPVPQVKKYPLIVSDAQSKQLDKWLKALVKKIGKDKEAIVMELIEREYQEKCLG